MIGMQAHLAVIVGTPLFLGTVVYRFLLWVFAAFAGVLFLAGAQYHKTFPCEYCDAVSLISVPRVLPDVRLV